jgi:hypothetical protein
VAADEEGFYMLDQVKQLGLVGVADRQFHHEATASTLFRRFHFAIKLFNVLSRVAGISNSFVLLFHSNPIVDKTCVELWQCLHHIETAGPPYMLVSLIPASPPQNGQGSRCSIFILLVRAIILAAGLLNF